MLAAADGKVLRVRNTMPDVNINKIDASLIQDREAGNGVVLYHGKGWTTQYSHLKQDSVTVKPGQTVKAGEKLGLIGLSGKTEFPHVEFSVRYKGEALDPFVGPGGWDGCGDTEDSLWTDAALEQMAYQATGLLSAGFARQVPQKKKARRGMYGKGPFTSDMPAIVFWVDLFGAQKGDRQVFRIKGPKGRIWVDQQERLDASNVSWFAYAGKRKPASGWPAGQYIGSYQLTRQGKTMVAITRKLTVR